METNNEERERLASELHDIYIKEAKRQGDVRHKDKYEDLTENIKDFDRVLADFIIADRARIVEPLVEFHSDKYLVDQTCGAVLTLINDTLWRSGVKI